jgi:xylan 1,4-beta-xylosidase
MKALLGVVFAVSMAAQGIGPGAAGKLRYVNPLSIEDTRSIADPTVLRFQGKYYLFVSGGFTWVSEDLVHWKHQPAAMPPGSRVTAPAAFEYQGSVYITGNDTGLYRARHPAGPYEYVGDFKDDQGKKMLLFDTMVFVDDDGRVYAYYSGRHADGIYGVELDRKDLTRFVSPPKKFWTFNPAHVWERYGDNNEGTELSWLEAPWMTKRNGKYYLQYSAPGTEWKTYAVGVYTAKTPLGPFTYAPRNPILVHRNGLINGTGHHAIIEGPDHNLWAVYTVLYRNWGVFDRRIGMDPVGFDKDGNMFVGGPSETPNWGPGANAKPALANETGSIAVSTNRYTWSASSALPGRDPTYAFDNNVRTWWQPAPDDAQPWLLLDLGCRNPADANQEFVIDSLRILFDAAPPERTSLTVDGHATWFPNAPRGIRAEPYKYKLEISSDNKTFKVVADRTGNTAANNVEFAEFAPVQCRFVRLTITGRPADVPMAVLEFTVFGKPAPSQRTAMAK